MPLGFCEILHKIFGATCTTTFKFCFTLTVVYDIQMNKLHLRKQILSNFPYAVNVFVRYHEHNEINRVT